MVLWKLAAGRTPSFAAGRSGLADLGVGVAHDGPTPTSASFADELAVTLGAGDPRAGDGRRRMVWVDGTAEATRLLLER